MHSSIVTFVLVAFALQCCSFMYVLRSPCEIAPEEPLLPPSCEVYPELFLDSSVCIIHLLAVGAYWYAVCKVVLLSHETHAPPSHLPTRYPTSYCLSQLTQMDFVAYPECQQFMAILDLGKEKHSRGKVPCEECFASSSAVFYKEGNQV
ncbi:hypothetical protein Anapl_16482 [Anas platyrhynchos]|uniref:Secreted protein n=1 Tax=Anas platyrhynchos TaxID=8839 RepID=R0L659_ANAPL|nr:hypothetical protein Anapl_16482 [Anas platyrhynchos]